MEKVVESRSAPTASYQACLGPKETFLSEATIWSLWPFSEYKAGKKVWKEKKNKDTRNGSGSDFVDSNGRRWKENSTPWLWPHPWVLRKLLRNLNIRPLPLEYIRPSWNIISRLPLAWDTMRDTQENDSIRIAFELFALPNMTARVCQTLTIRGRRVYKAHRLSIATCRLVLCSGGQIENAGVNTVLFFSCSDF